ncbi:MAG: HisA/HisF-related TIM barrel protein [Candidatus Alkanophagales archaeon]
MRVILALDILDGVVVHAVRGERERYRPIHEYSVVVGTSEPEGVVRAMKPREVYVADLNRLMRTGDNIAKIRRLRTLSKVLLDFGVESLDDVERAAAASDVVILGTETASRRVMEVAMRDAAKKGWRLSVSMDMVGGRVLSRDESLRDPLALVEMLNDYTLESLIVLELRGVGTKAGVSATLPLLSEVVARSEHDVIFGGGIRSCEDLETLRRIGVKGAIVATAVHDGSIPLSILQH